MPTILEPGNLVPQKWMSVNEKKRLETAVPIEYLMSFIEDRISIVRNIMPAIKPKGIGSRVIVLKSGTGSGKSTTIPPKLYDAFFDKIKRNIAVTQPRVLTAVDIPFQIIQYNKHIKIGDNIGYQTGSISRRPVKGITFMTTGTLLQQLKIMNDDDIMKKYGFIIIDEVHERSMEVDNVLYYMKQFLVRNWDKPGCPLLILMSATFDPTIFMHYYSCPKEHFIQISGSTYPIEKHFAEFNITDYIKYATALAEKIHIDNIADINNGDKFRDILIFVQGGAEINTITDELHNLNTTLMEKSVDEIKEHANRHLKKYSGGGGALVETDVSLTYYMCPIGLNKENFEKGGKDYKDLFSPIEVLQVPIYEFERDVRGKLVNTNKIIKYVKPTRRIIVSTNVAETGVTIDTLKYCIDSGWVKSSEFNPNFGCNMLLDKNITKAASEQRRGRVGRKAPGIWYACYTEEVLNSFPEMQFPDIVLNDISQSLLSIIIGETKTELIEIETGHRDEDAFQMNQFDQKWFKLVNQAPFDSSNLDFIQYPSADSIGYGVEKLYGLGFITHEYFPTLFGWYASKFRKLKLENIRMILAGYEHGANVLDLLTIACCIEVGFKIGINKRKYVPRNPLKVDDEEAFYYYKMLFCDEFIEYLFIWNDFMEVIGTVGDLLEKNIKSEKSNLLPMKYLPKWCEDNGFNVDGLMRIVELRDELIGDMLTMGINPYYNGLDLPRGSYNLVNMLKRHLSEGMEEIRKIKKCIYEGYRFNLCIWSDVAKAYVNNYSHVNVSVGSKIISPLKLDNDIIQDRPQKIIVSDIMLRKNFINPDMYDFNGGDISVLDGYVDVDVEFLNH